MPRGRRSARDRRRAPGGRGRRHRRRSGRSTGCRGGGGGRPRRPAPRRRGWPRGRGHLPRPDGRGAHAGRACCTSTPARSSSPPARPRSSRSARATIWPASSRPAPRERLHAAGLDLAQAVAVGTPPVGVPCQAVEGALVRFEGDDAGRVTARRDRGSGDRAWRRRRPVGRRSSGSASRRATCSPAWPARAVPVRAVGAAAEEHALPPAPSDPDDVVCRCMDVTVANLDEAWTKGFTELELLKRATLAGIGTCQGGACLPHVRAWIAARTGEVPAPFTARPASRQITLAEAAADVTVDAFRRTPLHEVHLAAGARMDRFGGWWRPWHYGDAVAEYWAVREGVSLGDVSTLGKLVVSGPDVVEALERLYPCHVADIKPGPLALRAAAQRARPRHGRRHDPARVGDPLRVDVHVGRRGQRRDVDPRLGRDLGPARPRPRPDDVAGRHQRHGPARRRAAGARRARPISRASSATPTPRWPACPAT